MTKIFHYGSNYLSLVVRHFTLRVIVTNYKDDGVNCTELTGDFC